MKLRLLWLTLGTALLLCALALHRHWPMAFNLIVPACGWCLLKGLT